MLHYQEVHTYFLSSLLAYCPAAFAKRLEEGVSADTATEEKSKAEA